MAIVKATFTRKPPAIKASLRYYTHRPTVEGERGAREIFGSLGALTKPDVYRMIDGARKGTYFYRLVLSPDPNSEDREKNSNLERLTRRTLAKFANHKRLGGITFAAVAHTDHTDKRHVHVIAFFPKKLTRRDLEKLRSLATEAALGKEPQVTPRHRHRSRYRPILTTPNHRHPCRLPRLQRRRLPRECLPELPIRISKALLSVHVPLPPGMARGKAQLQNLRLRTAPANDPFPARNYPRSRLGTEPQKDGERYIAGLADLSLAARILLSRIANSALFRGKHGLHTARFAT